MSELLKIMQIAKQVLPELSYVDEDYGQLELEEQETSYPVTFPCVLVGDENSDWSDLSPTVQSGQTTITVKLVIDCYNDTHLGSGTEGAIEGRDQMRNRLHDALQAAMVTPMSDGLSRSRGRSYAIGGGIKVYELTYTFTSVYESVK